MAYFISYAKSNAYDNRTWVVNEIVEEHPISWIAGENESAKKNRREHEPSPAVFVLLNFWDIGEGSGELVSQYKYGEFVEIKKG